MIKQYYYYDHTYGEGGVIGDFSKLMDFMNNSYDKDRHTVQDCLKSHKQCCKENDNPVEQNYYNSRGFLGFSVNHETENFVTADAIRKSIIKKLANLNDDDLISVVELDDTIKEANNE